MIAAGRKVCLAVVSSVQFVLQLKFFLKARKRMTAYIVALQLTQVLTSFLVALFTGAYLRTSTIFISVLQSAATASYSKLLYASQKTLHNKKLFIPSAVKSQTAFMNLVTIVSPRCPKCLPDLPLHYHSSCVGTCLFYFDHYCQFLQVKVYAGTQLMFMQFLLLKILELIAGLSMIIAQFTTEMQSLPISEVFVHYRLASYILVHPVYSVIVGIDVFLQLVQLIPCSVQFIQQASRLAKTLPPFENRDFTTIKSDVAKNIATLGIETSTGKLIPVGIPAEVRDNPTLAALQQNSEVQVAEGVFAKVVSQKEALRLMEQVPLRCDVVEKLKFLWYCQQNLK